MNGMQFTPQDWGQLALMGGLSILGNNNGNRSVGQLIGQGGLDALAGLQARKQYEAAMERQRQEDERAQAQHDLQMRQGNAALEAAARRAQLEQAAASGNEDAIKALAPLEWWKMQQQKAAASLAHQRALQIAAINAAKTGRKGTYDPKLGGVVYTDDASFVPVKMPEGYKAPKDAALEEQKQLSGNIVLEDIAKARAKAKDYFIIPNTGSGSVLKAVPGTNAADLDALLQGIGANIAFNKLNEMRQASPTGGALGQVTEGEHKRLQSVYGSLSQAQSEEQFLEVLERLERTYADIVHGAGNWRIVDGQIVVGKPEMVTEKPGNRGTGKRPSLSSFKR